MTIFMENKTISLISGFQPQAKSQNLKLNLTFSQFGRLAEQRKLFEDIFSTVLDQCRGIP